MVDAAKSNDGRDCEYAQKTIGADHRGFVRFDLLNEIGEVVGYPRLLVLMDAGALCVALRPKSVSRKVTRRLSSTMRMERTTR